MSDTGGWGEPEGDTDESVAPSGTYDLGDGHTMVLNPDAFQQVMRSAQVAAALTARGQAMADAANALAGITGAEYQMELKNTPGYDRPAAVVFTANPKAMVDDALNSTLLKVLAQFPSDPIPAPQSESNDNPEAPEAGDEEAAGEAGAEEGAAEGAAEFVAENPEILLAL